MTSIPESCWLHDLIASVPSLRRHWHSSTLVTKSSSCTLLPCRIRGNATQAVLFLVRSCRMGDRKREQRVWKKETRSTNTVEGSDPMSRTNSTFRCWIILDTTPERSSRILSSRSLGISLACYGTKSAKCVLYWYSATRAELTGSDISIGPYTRPVDLLIVYISDAGGPEARLRSQSPHYNPRQRRHPPTKPS